MPIIILVFICRAMFGQSQPLQTVTNVDINKYCGLWYEIASFPSVFQKDCHCTTANYSLSNKGYLIIENKCKKGSVNGKQAYIKGKAFVVPNSGNAKLKVQFFWPFKAKYWIIDLADDYSYAVVSNPSREYLWILARTTAIQSPIYNKILCRLKTQGFNLTKLKPTPQN